MPTRLVLFGVFLVIYAHLLSLSEVSLKSWCSTETCSTSFKCTVRLFRKRYRFISTSVLVTGLQGMYKYNVKLQRRSGHNSKYPSRSKIEVLVKIVTSDDAETGVRHHHERELNTEPNREQQPQGEAIKNRTNTKQETSWLSSNNQSV
jgi:hypothetical protein